MNCQDRLPWTPINETQQPSLKENKLVLVVLQLRGRGRDKVEIKVQVGKQMDDLPPCRRLVEDKSERRAAMQQLSTQGRHETKSI